MVGHLATLADHTPRRLSRGGPNSGQLHLGRPLGLGWGLVSLWARPGVSLLEADPFLQVALLLPPGLLAALPPAPQGPPKSPLGFP
ncbi:hypothetical protein [Thermus thermophilus]|uniref:Uncharacterized protein n=1 Tax=Thermus thermophilus TaxID=274 RepID=A0AAD1KW65_THETH|nr:hypothetical protein [Thermus thermophilus]BBL83487.1 hypothetical protein TthAA220_22710 [Thermus thermophilus]BBL85755.1 hypothetical protein TthAA229_22360 [Thermus thermophilus]BCZ88168.1 hypothetical protein TthAA11_23500 [Thermus thermophilus]